MHKLIINCGIFFAGKTTLRRVIAQRFGYVEVDVDDMKFYLILSYKWQKTDSE